MRASLYESDKKDEPILVLFENQQSDYQGQQRERGTDDISCQTGNLTIQGYLAEIAT
jgi:hypothetical protein